MTVPDHETAIQLERLRAEMHALTRDISRIASAVEKTLDDHEKRLRVVETQGWKMAGVVSFLAVIGPLIARKLGWL